MTLNNQNEEMKSAQKMNAQLINLQVKNARFMKMMGFSYHYVGLLEISTMRFETIFLDEKLSNQTPFEESFIQIYRNYLDRDDIPFHCNEMNAFLDPDTLVLRIKNQESISMDFYSYNLGWCKASFINEDKSQKKPEYVYFIIQNIEEEKARENRLKVEIKQNKDELERYKNITKSLCDSYMHVFSIDLINKRYEVIISKNENVIQEGEYPANSKYGAFLGMIDPEFRKEAEEFTDYQTLAQRLKGKKFISMEYKHLRYGWSRIMFLPFSYDDDENVTSVLLTISVIETQKRKELDAKEALKTACDVAIKANMAKTDFLSRMSHDLRTPMNAMMGMTEIAKVNLDNKEKVSDCLDKIQVSSNLLMSLLNEVLDMSKIESGVMELNEEKTDLYQMFREIEKMEEQEIKAHQHTLHVDMQICHNNVFCDGRRLQSIVINLLSNAIKYTPDGGQIDISVQEFPYHGGVATFGKRNKEMVREGTKTYEIVVKDNGIGMSGEFLEHIFEPFTREDGRTEEIRGTGLGMSIVYSTVRAFDGDINVKSKVNVGSIFTISLPLQAIESEEDDSREQIIESEKDDSREQTIKPKLDDGQVQVINQEDVKPGQRAFPKEDLNLGHVSNGGSNVGENIENQKSVQKTNENFGTNPDTNDIMERTKSMTASDYSLDNKERQPNQAIIYSKTDESMKSKEGEIDFSSKRVLLVEDQYLNREIAEEFLKMIGVGCEYASNGRAAVEMIENHEEFYYDLIFMDIQMPIMNGYEAARTIRAMDREDTVNIPIIAMSANAFLADVKKSEMAGMNEHVSKPVDFNKFRNVLIKYLTK